MPGRILQDDIEALKRRADLADVIGDHTKLKRSGSRLAGLCPFHQENTPSLSVDPELGVYHCFGCQEGGDVYSFLQRVEGLSFTEAVEQLARRVGYQLRYEQMSAGQRRALGERSELVAVNEAAIAFYREQLLGRAGEVARDYLKARGFGREEADRFRLGFAPLDWEALTSHLREQKVDDRTLLKSGLAVENQRGGLRDRFRGRLLFPIFDLQGDPIGFGGRTIPDLDYGEHEPPKYLNTAETPLYRKHRVLYGMSWARPEISRSGEVLVCEGYTDVIALHQAGIGNAVATCGTAVGEEHLRLLARYADRAVLAFDADEAGARAAERAFSLAGEHLLDVFVLVLPEGEDPAEVVRTNGAEAMRELVDAAEPVVRFMLRRAIGDRTETPEERTKAVESAAPLLAQMPDAVLRDQYTRWTADAIGVGLAVVAQSVEDSGGELAAVEVRPRESAERLTGDSALVARARLEREALRVVTQRPDLLPDLWNEVTPADFAHPRARVVFETIITAGGPGAALESVLDAAPDDDVRALLRALALEEFTVAPDEPHVAMLIGRILLQGVERRIAERKTALEAVNPNTDPEANRDLLAELVALEARRRELLEVASG